MKKSSIFVTQSATDLKSDTTDLTESITRMGSGRVEISTNSSVLLQALIEINDKNSNISISRKSFVRVLHFLFLKSKKFCYSKLIWLSFFFCRFWLLKWNLFDYLLIWDIKRWLNKFFSLYIIFFNFLISWFWCYGVGSRE